MGLQSDGQEKTRRMRTALGEVVARAIAERSSSLGNSVRDVVGNHLVSRESDGTQRSYWFFRWFGKR